VSVLTGLSSSVKLGLKSAGSSMVMVDVVLGSEVCGGGGGSSAGDSG